MVDSLHLGTIIKETGDVGRFQIFLLIFIEFCLLSHSWSMLFMVFGAAVPEFQCSEGVNSSSLSAAENGTDACLRADGSDCEKWKFSPSMRTIVSEFALVCDRKWYRQTITTLQMSGLLIGAFLWGHICDAIGRRYTFFLGFGIVAAANLISIFSVNWQMLAAMRFIMGFGLSGVNASSVFFEFIRNKWRMWFGIIPGWSVFAGLMALFCSNIADWRYILAVACAGSVFPFLGWRLIPESYRWLVARGRFEEAEVVIKKMARMNKKPVPDLQKIRQRMEEDRDYFQQQLSGRIYTVVDLLRTRKLFKTTALFSFIWLSGMFGYYGIAFNVPQLSGNLYMNMFLITVVDLPGPICVAILNIWFGRKWTSFGLNGIAGISILIAGVLEKAGSGKFSSIITVFVMASKLACNASFYAFAVWTMESFPTVIRHIGRGCVECISRIGAMLAPQFISLSLQVPGLLYFMCGALMILSATACIFLVETKNTDLEDILPTKHKHTSERGTELNKL